MKCCDQYPNKQLVIYGEGEPATGNYHHISVCGSCGTIHVKGQVYYLDIDICFDIDSRPALDAVSIPVRDAEKRGKK